MCNDYVKLVLKLTTSSDKYEALETGRLEWQLDTIRNYFYLFIYIF